MATIQDFIRQATANLRLDEDTVRNATGGLLGYLQGQIGTVGAQRLFSQIPGAADLASAGTPGPGTVRSSSILGNLTRMVGAALPGKAGATLGLAGTLKSSGIEFAQVPTLLAGFVDFVQQNVSDEVVNQILEKAPELRRYAH